MGYQFIYQRAVYSSCGHLSSMLIISNLKVPFTMTTNIEISNHHVSINYVAIVKGT